MRTLTTLAVAAMTLLGTEAFAGDSYQLVSKANSADCILIDDKGRVVTQKCNPSGSRFKETSHSNFAPWIGNARAGTCLARGKDNPLNLVQADAGSNAAWNCQNWQISSDGEISFTHADDGKLCITYNGTRTVPSVVRCNGSANQRWALRTSGPPPAPRPDDTTLAGAFIGYGPGLITKGRPVGFKQGYTAERCVQECLQMGSACVFAEFRPSGSACAHGASDGTGSMTLTYGGDVGAVVYLKKGTVSPKKVFLEGTNYVGTVWEGTAEAPPVNPNAKDGNGDTTLHRAVAAGQGADALLAILQEGTSADIQNNRGNTALHLAVEHESEDTVRLLLDKGALVDVGNNSGETALFVAVANNDLDMVRLLLDRGANINHSNSGGANVLTKAVQSNGNVELIGFLVDKRATPSDAVITYAVDRKDYPLIDRMIRAGLSADTVLDRAMAKMDVELATKLLAKGARPKDSHVQQAVGAWNSEMVALLLRYDGNADVALSTAMAGDLNMVIVKTTLQHGADPSPHMARAVEMGSVPLVGLFVDNGADPSNGVMKAIELENKEMVRHLMELGAGIGKREYIAYPVRRGKADMVTFLLAQGADAAAGVEEAIDAGQHAMLPVLYGNSSVKATVAHLEMAVQRQNRLVVGAILDQGVDPNRGMEKAVSINSGGVVKVLVERGADPKPRELMVAAVTGDKDAAAAVLAAAGARVDWTLDDGGTTLLHNAAGRCSKVTGTLLHYKADPAKLDAGGSTALHLVAKGPQGAECRDLIDQLLDHGADVNAKDRQGRTPLDVVNGARKKRRLKQAGGA